MRLPVLVLLLVGVGVAAAAAQGQPGGPDDKVTAGQRKQLAAMLDTVRNAERVEALPMGAEGTGLDSMARVIEKPVPVDAAAGRALGRVLTQYDWTRWSPMACMFQPAVAFRFRRGAEAAIVQVCFLCGEMALDGMPGPFGDKKILDPRDRNAFLRAAKKAFPNQFDGFEEEDPDVRTKGR
jgi:hypothetical protein